MSKNIKGDYVRTCTDCGYEAAGQKSDVDRLFRRHRKAHDNPQAKKVEESKTAQADIEVAPESFVDAGDATPATDTPSVDV